MAFENITEIKKANTAAGFHWFSQNCRTETPIIGGYYWVESRPRDSWDDTTGHDRWYSAVRAFDDGSVDWVDNNKTRLETAAEARALIDAVINN